MKKISIFSLYILTAIALVCCKSKGVCISGDCVNGYGVYKYPDRKDAPEDYYGVGSKLYHQNAGGTYSGEWKDGKRNGQGTMHFGSSTICRAVYEGEWKDDERNGYGVLKIENGHTYRGNWKNGVRSGVGIAEFVDGSKYQGEWLGNEFYGSGKFTFADGTVLKTKWYSGIPDIGEICSFTFPDGTTHETKWPIKSNDRKAKNWPGKCIYGNCENGYGIKIDNGGSIYFGNWKDGKIYGNWKMNFFPLGSKKMNAKESNSYSSMVYRYMDEMSTFIKLYYHNGNRYKSIYKRFDGFIYEVHLSPLDVAYGKVTYGKFTGREKKGSIYEGDVKSKVRRPERHGYGKFTEPGGKVLEGYFKDNEYIGKGDFLKGDGKNGFVVFELPDGSRYEGNFKDGKRSGRGKFYYGDPSKGIYYDGQWNNNRIDGKGTMVFRDKSRYVGMWKDGRQHGSGKLYKDGELVKEGLWMYGYYQDEDKE